MALGGFRAWTTVADPLSEFPETDRQTIRASSTPTISTSSAVSLIITIKEVQSLIVETLGDGNLRRDHLCVWIIINTNWCGLFLLILLLLFFGVFFFLLRVVCFVNSFHFLLHWDVLYAITNYFFYFGAALRANFCLEGLIVSRAWCKDFFFAYLNSFVVFVFWESFVMLFLTYLFEVRLGLQQLWKRQQRTTPTLPNNWSLYV